MAITHFRISQLPARGQLLLSATPVTLNQSITLADQSNLVYQNTSGFKSEAIDTIKYQVTEDEIEWSNEATILVNDFADGGVPGSVDDTLALALENQQTNLKTPTDYLQINSNTDRIKILNFTTNAEFTLKLNGNIVSPGNVIFVYDLENLVFENLTGGGDPFQTILYQCGSHLGFDNTIYALTINVNLQAEVTFAIRTTAYRNEVISNITYARTVITDQLTVLKGSIEKTAAGQLAVTAPMFAVNANNQVSINDDQKTANGTYAFPADFDSAGRLVINIEHSYLDMTGEATTSEGIYTLLTVNGDAGLVDSANDDYTSSASFLGMAAGAGGAVTNYRSFYDNDGNIYGGYLDGATPVIKRINGGIIETASGVTNLETDWSNRLNLTYA